MERTARPSLREVPVMHSAEQDAEQLGLRHTVDLLDQICQLVHSLECRGRDFLVHTDRTPAVAQKLAAGTGLVVSSKDLVVLIVMDHQREYG